MSPVKRRSKGDGGLYKRADGVWIGRVELPLGPAGERRQRTVSSKSFETAAERLRKLRNDVAEGRISVTGSTTVARWLDRWLNEIHAEKIKPTTRRDYQTAITLHIVPAIGTKRLDKLTVQHVRQMHAAVGKRRAAEKAHVILKKALKDAIREGMITHNVAEMLDAPKYKKTRRQSMSVEVAKHIIATAYTSRGESEATRWAAAFLTGARQSELLGLRWSYINLNTGIMDISWQLQQLSQIHGCGDPVTSPKDSSKSWPCGKVRPGWCPQRRWDLPADFEYEICHRSLVWTRPKTEAGGRHVPIVAPLLVKLRHLAEHQAANPHGLVWHYRDGRPIGPREDYDSWRALLVEAKVIDPAKCGLCSDHKTDHADASPRRCTARNCKCPGFKDETMSMHVARHTTATLLRAAGVDEQTRMEILGHATVDSQRIYAHADQQRHQLAMGTLDALLQ